MTIPWWREPNVRWLSFCLVVAFLFRLLIVQQQAIVFWYDQARDFTVSQQIIEQHDVKIQGPSASGTKDTVYHGVLYYYLIAPVVSFSGGSPFWTTAWLALLGSTAVIPTYLLVQALTGSTKAARWASFLLTFSFYHVQASTWLSNPQLMSFITPWILLFSWKAIVQQQEKYYPWLALTLAISVQSAIVNVFYVLGVCLLQLICLYSRKSWKFISWKNLILSVLIFGLGISTMLLTELLMVQRGILTSEVVAQFDRDTLSLVAQLLTFFRFNWRQLLWMVSGNSLIGILALVVLGDGLRHLTMTTKRFLLFWWVAPWFVLAWHFRDSPQTYIGLDTIIITVLAVFMTHWQKKNVLFGFIVGLIVMSGNIWSLHQYFQTRNNIFSVQKGAFLRDQIALVDQTYRQSQGKPFSISMLTNPYGINVTWGYLYAWSSREWGYQPNYVGPDQAGIVGEDLLSKGTFQTQHFLIREPDTGLDVRLEEPFIYTQNEFTSLMYTDSFGSLQLEDRLAIKKQ